MNEQKKVTLPGSISNIPTTNYGRAYSIVSTWAHHYTPDEMKRLLIGRGVDINDIDVEAMHKACTGSLEGLTAPTGDLEITYEDGTKESRSASASLMQPKTPEEQENAWTERKRGLIVAALARHQGNVEKLVDIEKLTQSLFSKDRTASQRMVDMQQLADLLGVNTLDEDPAWDAFKSETLKAVPGMHARPTPIRLTGESEFSRIRDYGNRGQGFLNPWNLQEKDGPGDERFSIHMSNPQLGDIFGLLKPSPAGEQMVSPYKHVYRTYSDAYLREEAIKRKAKRVKNQRRRRNAKARRK